MNLPDTVRTYLDRQQLSYRLIPYPPNEALGQAAEKLDIPVRRIARTVLLKDATGPVMAILPYSHILDFSLLCQLRECELEPLHGIETIRFFQARGCKGSSRPPLPAETISALGLTVNKGHKIWANLPPARVYRFRRA